MYLNKDWWNHKAFEEVNFFHCTKAVLGRTAAITTATAQSTLPPAVYRKEILQPKGRDVEGASVKIFEKKKNTRERNPR